MKAILFDFGGTIDTNGVHWSEMFWGYYQRRRLRVRRARAQKRVDAGMQQHVGVRVAQQA